MTVCKLAALLERVELAWLVFSSGYSWYRGGLEGWAGRSGRLDIVARFAAAACSPGVAILASLRGPALLALECRGSLLDEPDAGRAILDALEESLYPGLDGREAVAVAKSLGYIVFVFREGCRLSRVPSRGALLVIGADVDPPRWVDGVADGCIGVGPLSYLASVVAAAARLLSTLD